MKTSLLFISFILSLFIITDNYAAHLRSHMLIAARIDGSQQVPSVVTNAQGVAGISINATRDTLCVSVGFTGLSGTLMGAHIHEGAIGINGGVLLDLTAAISGNSISTFFTGANIDQNFLDKLLSGNCYINLHTAAFPNGEIRGQLLLEADKSFQVMMDGSQEVPATTTNAYGVGYFDLSKDLSKIKYYVVMQNLSGPLTGAHLHDAVAGMAGGVVFDLTSNISGNVISGVISNPSTTLINSMNGGSIYVNVHNASFPGGEIRGQLINNSNHLYFDSFLNGAQQVPPVTTTATGVATVNINTRLDSLWVDAAVDGLSGMITAAHFHSGNPGVNGGVEVDLTSFINGNRITGMITGAILTEDLINDFLSGVIYLNVHTAANPNGEIRGQVYRLIREGYTISLDGLQEVPSVSTVASGKGIVSIDRDQDNAHFMIVTSGLSANGAHFHNAVAGQNGGVIFDLTPYYINNAMYGYWKSSDAMPFNVANSVKFRNDSIYVNLHTAANPGGEIRGQVIRGYSCMSVFTGLGDVEESTSTSGENIKMYPNPAESELNINVVKGSLSNVNIYDYQGNNVLSEQYSEAQTSVSLNINELTTGLYLLQISGSDGKRITKVFSKL